MIIKDNPQLKAVFNTGASCPLCQQTYIKDEYKNLVTCKHCGFTQQHIPSRYTILK